MRANKLHDIIIVFFDRKPNALFLKIEIFTIGQIYLQLTCQLMK